jgi:hypothetical protein
MARTKISQPLIADNAIGTVQIKDGSVKRSDIDTSTPGESIVTKVIAGTNVSISSTGIDVGTGDVTVSVDSIPAATQYQLEGTNVAQQIILNVVDSSELNFTLVDDSANSRATLSASVKTIDYSKIANAPTDVATATDLTNHIGDATKHLTSDQNTWLDAITATSAEVNYTSGVTSSIQTQLNDKLPASVFTAANVLIKMLTVDGSGSGLDADLLDGNDSTYFAVASDLSTHTGDVAKHLTSDQNTWLDAITVSDAEVNQLSGVTSPIQTQINNRLLSSSYTAADILTKLKTVDGEGSGLDADLFNGIPYTSFALLESATFTGDVNIQSIGNAKLQLDSADGLLKYVRFSTNGYVRWDIASDDVHETGSNVGSNFVIKRYADSTSYLDTPFQIDRATGDTTVTNLIVSGDFTVNGTTSTINATTLTVNDKNIELGTVTTPSNITADGGGITLKGATDKTIIWDSANSNWTSSENWNLASGKVFKINNTSVLSSTTLGSEVTSSSLTSVGTLTSLTTSGQVTSTLATGTAPFAVTSTTVNTNLNADLLDGYQASEFVMENWSIKTTNYTAVKNDALFVDTTSGVVTITLPSSPTLGDSVKITDVASKFGTNKCTIGRNGSNIMGLAEDMDVTSNNTTIRLVYSNSTYGWRVM